MWKLITATSCSHKEKPELSTCRMSVLFSIPSSSQASRMYSTGVKPLPSSRVEKRRMPMVLVRADGVAILRPPSSKGCMGEGKHVFLLEEIDKFISKFHCYVSFDFRGPKVSFFCSCNLFYAFKGEIFDWVKHCLSKLELTTM